MEVPLDGTRRSSHGLGQGLHLGPAQPALIVGVVREGTICRDRLGGDTGEDEGLDLGDTGESGLLWHRRLLFWVRRCALMIRFIKAADSGQRMLRRFFLCSFSDAYFTYIRILALAPGPAPIPQSSHPLNLKFLSLGAYGRGISNLWRRKQ